MKISFQKITGLFLLFLFIIPGIRAQEIELDSTQIKMIKALGPEKVQLLVENMMKSSSPENQAKSVVLEVILTPFSAEIGMAVIASNFKWEVNSPNCLQISSKIFCS